MRLIALILAWATLAGCSTVNCNFTGDNNLVFVEQPKTVTATPSIKADGNSVPASVIP